MWALQWKGRALVPHGDQRWASELAVPTPGSASGPSSLCPHTLGCPQSQILLQRKKLPHKNEVIILYNKHPDDGEQCLVLVGNHLITNHTHPHTHTPADTHTAHTYTQSTTWHTPHTQEDLLFSYSVSSADNEGPGVLSQGLLCLSHHEAYGFGLFRKVVLRTTIPVYRENHHTHTHNITHTYTQHYEWATSPLVTV